MAAWAGLPLDLVGRILNHLPCLFHCAALSAVCYNWCDVVVAEAQPPRQLPWLLLPSTAEEEPVFFCLCCGYFHRVFLPDDVRTARCFGSHPGGWLALALDNYLLEGDGYALHNLRTGQHLDVPRFIHMPEDVGEVVTVVLGAALSAAPTAEDACLAVVLDQCQSPIAFWLGGMAHLSPPMPFEPHKRASWRDMLPRANIDMLPGEDDEDRDKGAQIADVIYYEGHGLAGFHVLTNSEQVLVYTPVVARDGALTTRLVTYRMPGHKTTWEPPMKTIRRYLLDYFGQLLMVVRYVSMTEDGKPERTLWMLAFRLIRMGQAGNHGDRQARWERFLFPDDIVVMLGRRSSRAFVSPAVALDGLYFLDDANSFNDVIARAEQWRPFTCTDMGRYTVHQTVEQVFLTRAPLEFSPAVWFFHRDHADA